MSLNYKFKYTCIQKLITVQRKSDHSLIKQNDQAKEAKWYTFEFQDETALKVYKLRQNYHASSSSKPCCPRKQISHDWASYRPLSLTRRIKHSGWKHSNPPQGWREGFGGEETI